MIYEAQLAVSKEDPEDKSSDIGDGWMSWVAILGGYIAEEDGRKKIMES